MKRGMHHSVVKVKQADGHYVEEGQENIAY